MSIANKDMVVIPPQKIGNGIRYIIENAQTKCIVISPYLEILEWKEMLDAIKNAVDRNVIIELYIRNRHNYFNKSVSMLIDMGVNVFVVKNLHAKVYMNERNAIISSLNFVYYSYKHSHELGVFIGNGNIIADIIKYNYTPLLRIAYCISYKINYCISISSIADYFPELFSDLEINQA